MPVNAISFIAGKEREMMTHPARHLRHHVLIRSGLSLCVHTPECERETSRTPKHEIMSEKGKEC